MENIVRTHQKNSTSMLGILWFSAQSFLLFRFTPFSLCTVGWLRWFTISVISVCWRKPTNCWTAQSFVIYLCHRKKSHSPESDIVKPRTKKHPSKLVARIICWVNSLMCPNHCHIAIFFTLRFRLCVFSSNWHGWWFAFTNAIVVGVGRPNVIIGGLHFNTCHTLSLVYKDSRVVDDISLD